MTLDRLLHEIIPYRMHAVSTLNLAARMRMDADKRQAMEIYVDGKLRIEGNIFAFTNPALEAGLVHCRALLEFLGLREKNGKLDNRAGRRPTDVGIEHFNTPDGTPLKMVTPDDAANRYPGPSEEAKNALLAVFQVANKELAHVTEDLRNSPEHARLIEIASMGIPVLMVGCFYKPLGLASPEYKLTTDRATNDGIVVVPRLEHHDRARERRAVFRSSEL